MDVVIHAGAHITDEDRLINCLLRNKTDLAEHGTLIPDPSSYRKLLRDLMNADKDGQMAPDAHDQVVSVLMTDDAPERLVLSNAGFFGTPKMAIATGTLYAAAERRLETLMRIFRTENLSLCMAICNPASFLPAVFQKSRVNSFDEFMNGADPQIVRWSDMIARIRTTFPDIPITVWCNEDLPLLWGEVIRRMAGLPDDAPFEGEFSLLGEIMTETGLKRFHDYIETHPGLSESQKRRVIVAFLDKFARNDAIEEEVGIHGWTDDLINALTESYDQDFLDIQTIPGIDLITP